MDILSAAADVISGGAAHRTTVVLQDEVPAGTTDWTEIVSYQVPFDGTVESWSAWHVPGSADALEAKLERRSERSLSTIPEMAGEDFLTGEPHGEAAAVSKPVTQEDDIVIRAKNTNNDYDYRLRYKVTIDFAGGTSRLFGGGE